MGKDQYTLGLDFGTNSCRALILNLNSGETEGVGAFQYPSGENGIITDPQNSFVARQHPADYLEGLPVMISRAVNKARQNNRRFSPEDIVGIGVSATSSSILPIDEKGIPLALDPEFEGNKNALVWLWKDHSATAESHQITELVKNHHPNYTKQVGGRYSSEWFWSKIAHCLQAAPEVFQAASSFVEVCDYIPAVLSGVNNYEEIKRSVCAAGHKALYNEQWGGLPDAGFLAKIHSDLGEFRTHQFSQVYNSESVAGYLSEKWAMKLGLQKGIPIAVGIVDAHAGGVGAGVKEGTLVKILGTSACDILIHPAQGNLDFIPGISGIVKDSVIPGYYGIEAGQPAAGDLLVWFVNNFVTEKYGISTDEKFKNLSALAEKITPGENSLLALDWNNGNRSILDDDQLSGLLVGQTLHTTPVDIYRALNESVCFGSRVILEHLESYSIGIESVITCGGLAFNNPLILEIMANVLRRPVHLTKQEETSAFGAALYAAVAAGFFDSVQDAQNQFCRIERTCYPDEEVSDIYNGQFELYKKLHDSFGNVDSSSQLGNVMHELKNKVRY